MNRGLATRVNETEHGYTFNQFLLTGEQPFLYLSSSWNSCAGSPSPTLRPTSAVRSTCCLMLQFIPTPQVPHNWESGLWFDETTSTPLCGDLLEHAGQVPALTESDCVVPALAAEERFQAIGRTPNLAPTLEQLAQLRALSDGLAAP